MFVLCSFGVFHYMQHVFHPMQHVLWCHQAENERTSHYGELPTPISACFSPVDGLLLTLVFGILFRNSAFYPSFWHIDFF